MDLAHEVIDGFQDAFVGRGLRKIARDLVGAFYRHGRNAVDAIVLHHLRGASGLHGYAEGVEGRKKSLPGNAVRGQPCGHLVRSVQRDVLFMDGLENGALQAVDLAQRQQRVVELLLRDELRREGHRNAFDHHVGRLRAHPRVEFGLECIAVRAVVPEELRDHDLAWVPHRLPGGQLVVARVLLEGCGGLRNRGARGDREKHGEQGEEALYRMFIHDCVLDSVRRSASARRSKP